MQTADLATQSAAAGNVAAPAETASAYSLAETAGSAYSPAETAGLKAMADALVASGRLTRASADQMLHAELTANQSAGQAIDTHPAPARDAQGRWTASNAASTTTVRPETVVGHVPHERSAYDDGSAPSGSGSQKSGSPRTEEVGASPDDDTQYPPLADIEIDPLFAPPDTPQGYQLALNPAVKMDVAEVEAVRGWFHTLRLPQPIAQSIYSEVERMSLNPPDDAAIERMNASTMSELSRAWGERTGSMMGHAKRLIDAAAQTHPYLKTALSRGPGSHPAIVRQLAEHAARLYAKP